MAEIGSWNGHAFTVSPNLIRSFTGLTIRGSSETEDKTGDGQKYVARKNSNPAEVSLTAELSALTGCDVQNEALQFVDEARAGAQNYFYLSGKKLIPCQLMLTEASVSETQIAPGGKWISCKVKLTMKQCAKYDGTSSGSGGSSSASGSSGSKKSSVRTSSTKISSSQKVTDKVSKDLSASGKTTGSTATGKASGALKSSVAAVQAASKASATTKRASVGTKVLLKK